MGISIKTEEDKVNLWKQRIQVSFLNSKQKREKYEKNLEFYKGNHYPNDTVKKDKAKINLIFRIVQIMMPYLYYKNPYIIVKSKKPDIPSKQRVVECALNQEWHYIGMKKQARKMIFNALLKHKGYIQVGYETKTEEQILESGESNVNIKSENVWAVSKDPENIFLDGCDDLDDSKWYAIKYYRTPDEIRNDKNLKTPKDLKDIKPTAREKINGKMSIPFPDDLDKIALYDIYDRVNGKLYTIAEGFNKFLRDEENPYNYLNGFNLVELKFNEEGVSDIENLIPLQQEINRIRTVMLNHSKRFNRKYLYNKSKISEEEIEKLSEGEDGALIGIESGDLNPNVFISPMQDAPIPNDQYNVSTIIKNEFGEISGQPEYTRGGSSQDVKLATVAMVQENMRKFSADEKLDLVSDVCVKLTEKMFKIMQKNYSQDKIYRMTGMDGSDMFVRLTRDGLDSDYDFDIQYASTTPMSKEIRRNDLILAYEKFKDSPMVNQNELLREILLSLDLPNVNRILSPEQAPDLKNILGTLMSGRQDMTGGIPPSQTGELKQNINMPESGITIPQENLISGSPSGITETNPYIEELKARMGELGGGI